MFFYIVLKEAGVLSIYPSNNNLIHNDAIWYQRIVERGYYYIEGSMNTMAFFPLFSYIWKLLGLNALGISILNGCIYLTGMYLIIKHLKLSLPQSLLTLSIPSMFFCYIPYSEAFFFLGSTLLLIGLDKEKPILTFSGILITSFTRSVGIVFFPALLYILLIHWKKNAQEANLRKLVNIGWCCLIIIMSTILVMFIQYLETGEWFVFFKVQKIWNRYLNIPTLPFTTMSGTRMLWLDGCAFFISIVSFSICIWTLILFVLRRKSSTNLRSVDFSLAYLVMMGFLCSFFSGIWSVGEGTSLMSINRYILAGPFIIFFIHKTIFSVRFPVQLKDKLLIPILLIITWCLLGGYRKLNGHYHYWQTLVYFMLMSLYLFLYHCILKNSKFFIVLYIVNLFLQAYLLHVFLSAGWVG